MDFNNGLYVFNGVPGLDASKGERVAKALQKLQAKIKHLEQVREIERETSLKNETADSDQDITIAHVRFKLLHLQLQYMRALLKNNKEGLHISENAPAESEQPDLPSEDSISENCCKETQTGMSLLQNPDENTSDVSQPFKHSNTISDSGNVPIESIPPSTSDAQMHYHLNFEDVPFILGSSTSDSHNLLANVQNVLAKMKTHNRVLCGQRCHTSKQCKSTSAGKQPSQDYVSTSAGKQPSQDYACTSATRHHPQDCASTAAGRQLSQDDASTSARRHLPQDYASTSAEKHPSQDTNKMMQDLSQQLLELQIKQAKLMETIDTTQSNSRHIADKVGNKPDESHFRRIQKFSNTDFPKAGTTHSKDKQQRSNRVTKTEKHVVPINKIQANLPQIARQRLLRSIREVKTHLSEDDISWI